MAAFVPCKRKFSVKPIHSTTAEIHDGDKPSIHIKRRYKNNIQSYVRMNCTLRRVNWLRRELPNGDPQRSSLRVEGPPVGVNCSSRVKAPSGGSAATFPERGGQIDPSFGGAVIRDLSRMIEEIRLYTENSCIAGIFLYIQDMDKAAKVW